MSSRRHLEKKVKSYEQKIVSPDALQNQKKIAAFVITAILAAVPFWMGKYIEFNSPDPFDSGSNVYSAKHILDGARIGIEEQPSAALGTLLVNILGVWAFGFNEFGPKLIQMIFQAAALVLMFIAMRRLFGTLAAAVGVVVTSIYISAPLIAKFGNVKEQYMIACMVMGISCFALQQLGEGWWYAIPAGAFLSWAPLFKETGTSAIGAVGVFIILQPFLKNRTWKQTAIDIGLLASGAAIALAPLYVWIIGWDVKMSLPYSFVWPIAGRVLFPAKVSAKALSYITASRESMPFSELWPRVLRHYGVLILPVALATGSIAARIVQMVWGTFAAQNDKIKPKSYDRFVLLLAVWWLLDMGFVWISPRSYEQYYLPLTASGAMLGGYLIAVYYDALSASVQKAKWILTGAAGLVCMTAMVWHIFFGIEKSPFSNMKYPQKSRGYIQSLEMISEHKKGTRWPWELVGDYIRNNSAPSDKIYVWGWYPGIYVQAQRFSCTPKAFESEMHLRAPEELASNIQQLLAAFEKEKPKFIVDSRKVHMPLDRPPLEIWPIMPKGFMGLKEDAFLPLNKNIVSIYDSWWSEGLRKRFGEDEAMRYEAMRPFREFVMKNYRVVGRFGIHVLFQLKSTTENKELR